MHSVVINVFCALLAAPLMPGIVNRVKAWFAGRTGQPLLQTYFDILKLCQKGAVYSRTTTWLFQIGPIIGLACSIVALTVLFGENRAESLSKRGSGTLTME